MADKKIDPTGLDAYKPADVALRIEEAGVRKASLPAVPLATLSVLAGVFIALGAAAFTAAMTGTGLTFGPSRLLGGFVFSTGLILVVVAGAELFTGNALIVMAWVDGRVSPGALMRNWGYSYVGNFIGALAVVALMALSGLFDGPLGETARKIAEAKSALGPVEAFTRGLLCNMLVCLAVWLTFAARSVTDKILAIILPITAFVLLGYEHSVANMYLIPAGWAAGLPVDLKGFLGNLIPVSLGNVAGGAGGVALTYWLAYRPKGRG
ncbi:formate/nitrite transporter family protein [Aestuariivirga sp.]|uniref:formate/nitrite transporter family protein n=1 Tax=Aestuariivirga sp. TaxID=2650926 RepID=UPI0035930FCA